MPRPTDNNATTARQRRLSLPQHDPRRTREEHSHEIAQDYVEIIADLIAATGEARVIDLARRLGVTHVTVARTIQRLQRDGLVTSLPYRSIFLTGTGRKLSEESRSRHDTVVDFLEVVRRAGSRRAVGRGRDRAPRQPGNAQGLREAFAEEKAQPEK